MGKKYFDDSWDFRDSDTKIFTHCFHSYPAMMIPQIAGRLLDKYGKKASLLFDPYCGLGTSLVEANLRGINAIGTDLNPLARLIAKSKATPIDAESLDMWIRRYNDFLLNLDFGKNNGDLPIPHFMNIDFWFDKRIQKTLAAIKGFISQIDNNDIANFFKVAFSETVRESSWTKNGEFKLVRMTEEQRDRFNPNVYGIMNAKLNRNKNGLTEFNKEISKKAITSIYDFNTVEIIPQNIIRENSINIIITSPPYGDSRTTVAYGQYSRLSSQWLGFPNANSVDKLLMGGRPKGLQTISGSKLVKKIIDEVASKDSERAQDVISFYIDYQKSITNISKIIKKGGHACYVVGNRKVKGIILPTDEITRQLFEAEGFEHIETIMRNIPNKRMPSKNSPSNIPGVQDTTICNEFIVIMKKLKVKPK
jgi:DNA modification methylase